MFGNFVLLVGVQKESQMSFRGIRPILMAGNGFSNVKLQNFSQLWRFEQTGSIHYTALPKRAAWSSKKFAKKGFCKGGFKVEFLINLFQSQLMVGFATGVIRSKLRLAVKAHIAGVKF